MITITNNKGRLNKEEIEKLIKEAENFKSNILLQTEDILNHIIAN